LAAALGQLGRLDEARSATQAALALNPAFTFARARSLWTAMGDEPRYLAGLQPVFEGLRKAVMPGNDGDRSALQTLSETSD
jgi:hypothetical protein